MSPFLRQSRQNVLMRDNDLIPKCRLCKATKILLTILATIHTFGRVCSLLFNTIWRLHVQLPMLSSWLIIVQSWTESLHHAESVKRKVLHISIHTMHIGKHSTLISMLYALSMITHWEMRFSGHIFTMEESTWQSYNMINQVINVYVRYVTLINYVVSSTCMHICISTLTLYPP